MKPLRLRLQEARKRLGIPWEILERDYLLSWILAGITHVELQSNCLSFSGKITILSKLKRLFFHSSKRQATHDLFAEYEREDHDRNKQYGSGRSEPSPVYLHGAPETGDRHGHRLRVS